MSKERRQPEVLTPTECQTLAGTPNPRYRTGLRDQCMIRLMLNTGLKVSECLQLRVSDIDWSSGQLNVKGRGEKARTLWINDEVLSLLGQWLERRPVDCPLLFTTLAGKPVSDRAFRAMIKRRARKAGIAKDVHPHMLRHSFATQMYHRTQDLRGVQKMLGHASFASTLIYTPSAGENVERTMKDLNLG